MFSSHHLPAIHSCLGNPSGPVSFLILSIRRWVFVKRKEWFEHDYLSKEKNDLKMIICQKKRMIWTCKCRPRSNWGSLPRCQPHQARRQHLQHQHHLQPLPRANLEAPSAPSAPSATISTISNHQHHLQPLPKANLESLARIEAQSGLPPE